MADRSKRPYVGVSGVISPEIENTLESISVECGLHDRGRLLALGVKAVRKTQFLDIPNKYGPDWYPIGEDSFRNALRHENNNPNTIGVAQAYFDSNHVHDPAYRSTFLSKIIQRGKPWLEGIQFDMLPWHSNDEMWGLLETAKEKGLAVFLQVHGHAMAELGPKASARKLARHTEHIDYVLFDSSHGSGTRLHLPSIQPFIAEAHERLDLSRTGVAIAGGLNCDIVREDLPHLLGIYPDLSWDAEGQLHPINTDEKRPLDLEVTKAYLKASSIILSSL